ncbi:hypothetical protein ABKN59_001561 [Abortiporus biennis]
MAMYCIVWQGFTITLCASCCGMHSPLHQSSLNVKTPNGAVARSSLPVSLSTARLPNNNFHSFALTSLTWFVPRDDDSFVGVNLLSSFMILPISPLRSPPWRCGVEGRGGVDSKCDQTRRECQPRHWTVFI